MSLTGYYDTSYPPSLWAPDPGITSLSPNTGSAAAGPILVTVNGENFESGSVIEIDHVPVATTFVSATQLTTSFDPATARTYEFTVRNPSDEESNSMMFTAAAEQSEPQSQTFEAIPVNQSTEPNPEVPNEPSPQPPPNEPPPEPTPSENPPA